MTKIPMTKTITMTFRRSLQMVLILLVALLLSHCQSADRIDSFSQPDAEQFIGVELPHDASDVKVASESGIDRIVYLRFHLPPQLLDQLLASLQFDTPLKPSFMPFTFEAQPDLDWWLRNEPISFSGGSKYTEEKVFEIVVDQTDQQLYIIYLRIYEL